jgi:hypothetical protein
LETDIGIYRRKKKRLLRPGGVRKGFAKGINVQIMSSKMK